MLTSEGELEFDDAARTRLYRNDGDMQFVDVTRAAGIDLQCFGFGGAACDYDADGDADVYVCAWGRNTLLRNNGDGTFTDVAEAAGLVGDEEDMSTSCAWGDVDGDGVHDLYVANYIDQWKQIREYQADGRVGGLHCDWRGFKVYCGPPGLTAQKDRLYLGNEDGTFREVTGTHLTKQKERYAFQPVMTDINGDGHLDIYVANDTQNNTLWVNDGTGVFKDLALEAGVAMNVDMKAQAGMGVDAADVNRDGRIDLCVTNFSHDYNTLYVNSTTRVDRPIFGDRTHKHGAANLSYRRLCWGTRLFDMDCDSDLDFFVACGHVYGEIDNFSEKTGTTYKQANLLLRNQGAPSYGFEDVTEQSGPAFEIERVWRGACFGDFDDDGDQDVFVTSLNGPPAMLRNDGGNRNGWLRFRLVGKGMQRDPSGAQVAVTLNSGVRLLEELHHGASFCGDNDPRLHFGTGADDSVKQVTVRWPNGETQSHVDVKARQGYVLDQTAGTITKE